MTSKGPSSQHFEVFDAKAQCLAQEPWRHSTRLDDRQSARLEAAHVDLPALSLSQVRSVTQGLSDETGRGFDSVGPSDIHSLPALTVVGLLGVYHEIERQCQWPWQLMVNLNCLKPKPTSGDRGIALRPLLIWTPLRDAPAHQWSHADAGFWDQAVEGSSALKVALDRLMGDEIAQSVGTHTGCLYADIKEFYEYLCPVKTLKAALDLGFPAPIAVRSFSACGGARVLQGPDGCSCPLQAARGIITGNNNSNNFARAALYNLLEVAHSRFTLAQTRESG